MLSAAAAKRLDRRGGWPLARRAAASGRFDGQTVAVLLPPERQRLHRRPQCAGFCSRFSSVLDLPVEQLQRNLDMGPIAYLRTMQACYPYLKASGAGRVINFGSLAGIIGMQGYAPYNIAKEAVRALTRSAAREWGVDNITVNNVLPVADTWGDAYEATAPTNALGRYGSPEDDIAPVVLFLASQHAQFVTGYSLTPDGGQIIDSAR